MRIIVATLLLMIAQLGRSQENYPFEQSERLQFYLGAGSYLAGSTNQTWPSDALASQQTYEPRGYIIDGGGYWRPSFSKLGLQFSLTYWRVTDHYKYYIPEAGLLDQSNVSGGYARGMVYLRFFP